MAEAIIDRLEMEADIGNKVSLQLKICLNGINKVHVLNMGLIKVTPTGRLILSAMLAISGKRASVCPNIMNFQKQRIWAGGQVTKTSFR